MCATDEPFKVESMSQIRYLEGANQNLNSGEMTHARIQYRTFHSRNQGPSCCFDPSHQQRPEDRAGCQEKTEVALQHLRQAVSSKG